MSDNKRIDNSQIMLRDLPGAIPPEQAYLQVEQKDLAWSDEQKADDAALKEVVQNVSLSEGYMVSRGLRGVWDITEVMLRAYVQPVKWKGSDIYRSNLGIPLLAENFYSLLSAIQQGFWGGLRNFQIDPCSGTSINTALAQEALVNAFLKDAGSAPGIGAKQEMRGVVFDGLLYGTGVAIKGWKVEKYKIVKKRRKHQKLTVPIAGQAAIEVPQGGDPDELEDDIQEFEVNKPVLEHVPIRRFRCAPDCRRSDVRTASWAARYLYLTSYDLDRLRDVEGYNIPTREQLEKLTAPVKKDGPQMNPMDWQGASSFPDYRITGPQKAWPEYYDQKNNVDPLASKWEVIDYWTRDRHIMVLEKQFPIFNEPHDQGDNSFLSFNFREAPDSFFGWGLGSWLTDFQKIAQGIINAFFDDWSLKLLAPITRPMGMNVRGQAETIFPGKVFQVEGQGQVQALQLGASATLEPLALVSQVKQWAASMSGAGAGVQGTNPGSPGDMRNPSGVKLIASGEAMKTQDLMDVIADQIYIPFIQFCISQSHRLKPSQISAMLSKELEEAFEGDALDIINGDYKVTISAATKLAARQQINGALGFLSQMIQNGGLVQQLAHQGTKFNAGNFIKVLFEATGWPYREDIFEPMSDEEKQQFAQSQGNASKQAEKMQEIDAQTQSKIKVNENQSENRALLQMQKHALETSDAGFYEKT
jgi:hypothetical protein